MTENKEETNAMRQKVRYWGIVVGVWVLTLFSLSGVATAAETSETEMILYLQMADKSEYAKVIYDAANDTYVTNQKLYRIYRIQTESEAV